MAGDQNGQMSSMEHLLSSKEALERSREEEFDRIGPTTTDISKERICYLSRKFKRVCNAVEKKDTSLLLDKRTRELLESLAKKNDRSVSQTLSKQTQRHATPESYCLSNGLSCASSNSSSEDVRVPSHTLPSRSEENNGEAVVLPVIVDSPAVKTEVVEDEYYLAGSTTVPNKVLSSNLDGFDSDESMDSDGEYTNRPGYQRKRQSTVISVEDDEATETSADPVLEESHNDVSDTVASPEQEDNDDAPLAEDPVQESCNEPSMEIAESDQEKYVAATRDRLLDFFRLLKDQVVNLQKEAKRTNTHSVELLAENLARTVQNGLDGPQDGVSNEEPSSVVPENERREPSLGARAGTLDNHGDRSPEIFGPAPVKRTVKKKKIVKPKKPEPGPSELSVALQRLLDPFTNLDEELANLERLREKVRAEDTLTFGNRDHSTAEDSAESSVVDSADSGTTTEDEEERDRRLEAMIESVANEVGEPSSSEHERFPEKKLAGRSNRSTRNAEMDEEMKLLLNEISATDSEGDTDDARSVGRYRRTSGQSSDSDAERHSLSPLPADYKVERDVYDDSWSSDEHNESFDEFFKLLDAEKEVEKDEKRSRKFDGLKEDEDGEEEAKSEFSSTSASEADDENSSDDIESLNGDENAEANTGQPDENAGVTFRDALNANCKMTDEELEAQRRTLQLLGFTVGENEDKKEKVVSDNVTSDGENSSEVGETKKKKERKVLNTRDENVPKRTKPFFEVSESPPPRSSAPKVKKEHRSPVKKRPRIIESDSDEIPEPREPPKKKTYAVITVDSSAESETGLIFEERKRRLDAKKKQAKKSLKPIKLPNRPKRKVLLDHELSAESRRAKREEEERRERVDQLEAKREIEGHAENVLDVSVLNTPDEEPLPVTVSVHPQLWKSLRPHQKDGVRFMYRNVIQSVEHIQDAQYQGCILAHSMGLGKTLQVLAFLQAVLGSLELNVKTCLVLCPAAVVLNWDSEVKDWMTRIPQDVSFQSYVLKSKNTVKSSAVATAKQWRENGGILVMSYSLYLSYCTRAEKGVNKALLSFLRDPGPDILVCDEAHTLKSGVGKQLLCISQIATTARIALTGTPLQNNLGEYYTMVNFVKPALLGSSKEFKNQFQLPIEEGSKKESSSVDVRLMKQRSGILRHLLSGCLQIRGVSILTETIPPKIEYRITLRLSEMQKQLYKALLAHYASKVGKNNRVLMSMVTTAQMITFHPQCLQKEQEHERKKLVDEHYNKKKKKTKDEGSESSSETDEEIDKDFAVWFEGLLPSEANFITILGSKAIVVREILLEARALNEKVLIFSDRIAILGCLEELLVSIDKENLRTPDGRRIEFKPHVNYVSFDGSTGQDRRFELINKFNKNPNVTVFLLSIKAAGMGINLVSANRVILCDPSWNPTTDKQALFRAYRYGQTKPVYVYRLVSFGTTESKICDDQLKKDTMVGRVTEEKFAKRFGKNLETIFEFKELPFDPKKPFMPAKVPTDTTMIRLLERHPELIVNVEDYDSLLEADEAPLEPEEAVAGWLRYGWGSNDSDPADRGDPFQGRPVNAIKVAEAFNAEKNRCVKFKCEKEDFVALEAFIARYLKHVPRNLNRNERIQDTVKKVRRDMPILRNIVEDMRRKLVAQDLERQQQQQQQHHQQVIQAMQQQQQQRAVLPKPGPVPRVQLPLPANELHKRYGLDQIPTGSSSSPWLPVNNLTGVPYAVNKQNTPTTIYVPPTVTHMRMRFPLNQAPQQRMQGPTPYRGFVPNRPGAPRQGPAIQPRGFTGNSVVRTALPHPSTGLDGTGPNGSETAQQEMERRARERVKSIQDEARQRQLRLLREAFANPEAGGTSAALDLDTQRRAWERLQEAEVRARQMQQDEASTNRSNNASPAVNNSTNSPSE